ncbi:MAG: tRNA uridine-5-carboxymethylaminomethyl(34) synthesis GTPase MnmE [Thermoanaerobacteraceae bacterium]|nr:tRNA uridine-5-carboxymethylaminomethyl(34) synthesis GTPase MnmE [Thermoanaerobacteraceae bacterium]
MLDDTIAAVATPVGEGGIGIIRISGKDAVNIAKKIFQAKNKVAVEEIPSFTLRLGNIVDSEHKVIVDEVLLTVMRGPKSYTAEDVVEIHCHGGPQVIERILQLVLDAGARLAEPGEFTKRAFLNGRIDLVQAEAVIDVIRAKTDAALSAAVSQLRGKLSNRLQQVKERLIGVMAQMEASIDFPEEVGDVDYAELKRSLEDISRTVAEMIEEGHQGKVLKEGLKTVIVGRPNVGKSSLLNALLKEERAIVTDIPGTTRDIIEEVVNVNGIPLRIIDTAGIRETIDEVEKIGVSLARESLVDADLVLFVIDVTAGLSRDDNIIAEQLRADNTLVLLNKTDVEKRAVTSEDIKKMLPEFEVIEISAKEEWGLDKLANAIKKRIFGGQIKGGEREIITRTRHINALKRTYKHLKEAIAALDNQKEVDLIVIDVRDALDSFGEITGETVTEDILDTIFNEFCIGK